MSLKTIHRPLPHGGGKQSPNLIVVHAMAYQIEWEDDLLYAASFLDRIELSAHLLVSLDGTLIRCREDDEIAWHAKGYNQDSLGIEFLVPDATNYTDFLKRINRPWLNNKQFESGVEAVRKWMGKWGIENVKRHSDIDPRGIKKDPGYGFPWEEFKRRVNE